MATPETFQSSWIASLKSHPEITSLLVTSNTPNGAKEIKEAEWQGTDFFYPNIRVGLDFMPNECGPDDADVLIEVFSEEKTSKQAAHIASVIESLYHKRPFTADNVRWNTVIVKKVERANRSIYAWVSKIHIFAQGI